MIEWIDSKYNNPREDGFYIVTIEENTNGEIYRYTSFLRWNKEEKSWSSEQLYYRSPYDYQKVVAWNYPPSPFAN